MAFDVQAAKAAGYTQEEIDAYLQSQPKTKEIAPVAPGQEVDPGEPPPPEGTFTPAGEGNFMPAVATAAAAAAPYVVPAAIAGAGWKGMNVAKSAFDAMKESAAARNAQANAQMAAAQGLQQRAEMRAAQQAARSIPATPQILGANGMPMTSAPPTAPAAGSFPAGMSAGAPPMQPTQPPTAQNYMQRMAAMASRYAPVMGRVAGAAMPALAIGANLFGTSPEEIAILKAADEKRRRASLGLPQ